MREKEIEELKAGLGSRTPRSGSMSPPAEMETPGTYVSGGHISTHKKVAVEPKFPVIPKIGGASTTTRRGKAPPVDTFSGDTRFEDWLPALKRAAAWNSWSSEETLLQLAGHLRGRALEEWNLMNDDEKEGLEKATDTLKKRLDPISRMLAAQDFRRATQQDDEPIADYIRRLEQTFRVAYGCEGMSSETRDTLLFNQMQEGLRYELMETPAVSGATDYKQLCLASRNEEKRLVELKKRRKFATKSKTESPRSINGAMAVNAQAEITNDQCCWRRWKY